MAAILTLISFVFVARVLLSWVRIGPDSSFYPVANGIHRVTEPVLAPIRKVLPPMGGFDFSALIVIFGINFLLIPLVS